MLYVFFIFDNGSFVHTGVRTGPGRLSYDHTTMKPPHPIRTAKLSIVRPDQYFGRGLQGNLGCCMSFLFFFACNDFFFFCAKSIFESGVDTIRHMAPRVVILVFPVPEAGVAPPILMKQREEIKINFLKSVLVSKF